MDIKFVSLLLYLVFMRRFCVANRECGCDNNRVMPWSDFFVNSTNDVREVYKSRLVRGRSVSIQEYPHHAVVLMYLWDSRTFTYEQYSCGGCIIGTKWVLTAGHCRGEAMGVQVGSDRMGYGTSYYVKKTILFPEYFDDPISSYYDYLLLELEQDLKINDRVFPIELGAESDIIDGKMAHVTGFGRTSEGGRPTKNLGVVQVPIIKYDRCLELRPDLRENELCAGYRKGEISTCKGDSGGGLVFAGKLIGIVSRQDGCAEPLKPTVYSGIAYAKAWICKITGICSMHNKQHTLPAKFRWRFYIRMG